MFAVLGRADRADPGDIERRITALSSAGRWADRAAAGDDPGTVATGVRTAWDRLARPDSACSPSSARSSTGPGNIGVLWASFHAFGVEVPFGVVVQGFFVGMAANVIPSPAAGPGPWTPA